VRTQKQCLWYTGGWCEYPCLVAFKVYPERRLTIGDSSLPRCPHDSVDLDPSIFGVDASKSGRASSQRTLSERSFLRAHRLQSEMEKPLPRGMRVERLKSRFPQEVLDMVAFVKFQEMRMRLCQKTSRNMGSAHRDR
jgi:hypothetical protein